MEKFAAIVLSAGTGSRMKSDIPKQYMDLNGRPVIYYSLKAFEDSNVESIVLVTGRDDIEYCRKEIVEKYGFTKVKAIVAGGAERYDSVFEGLKAINDCDYVMIHDGARPMLDSNIIERAWRGAVEYKACVVGMPVKDTIRIVGTDGTAISTPDRKSLWQIQTPQAFDYRLIYEAYSKVLADVKAGKQKANITDDAMIVECASNVKVHMTEGDYRNIKITTPEDIQVAEIFLKKM